MRRELKFLAICSLVAFASCKTQEEIQREQMVDNLSIQMVENQKLTADSKVRLQNIEERLGMLTGQVEEESYNTKEELSKQVQTLTNKLTLLEERDKANQATLDITQKRMTSIEDKLIKQDKYLKKVLATLTGAKAVKKSSKKLSAYDSAMNDYKRARYKSAKVKLESLESNKKIKGKKRARVLHNLGMIAFMNKDNTSASAYFGKLFTEFPKSSYNANGLLYLAKTFQRMKQPDQAKQVLDELIKRFPKSKKIKEAKALKAKL